MGKNPVLIDSDFLQQFIDDTDEAFFQTVMEGLDFQPVVIPYVADVELVNMKAASSLIRSGVIKRIAYEDFLKTKEEKSIFRYNTYEIYKKVYAQTGNAADPEQYRPLMTYKEWDIYSDAFHSSKGNVGEILCEVAAKELKIAYFASNDRGAKSYARQFINSGTFSLNVMNVSDLVRMAVKIKDIVSWKEVKRLLRAKRWEKEKREIGELWKTGGDR